MKLTLRELFLLVVIAAMGCGWWVERLRALDCDRLRAANSRLSREYLEAMQGWRACDEAND